MSGDGAILPFLSLLLAAADEGESGACCFLLPCSTGIAMCSAILGALSRLQAEFPRLLENHARQGFQRGQRVRVLPSGHVYEFQGLFDDPRLEPSFRLKVVDNRTRTWRHNPILEPTYRSFPIAEILRLQPTTRSMPLGRENTALGPWEESPLDRLLGIRSGFNTALFRNHVLLLTSRSEAELFASITRIARPGREAARVADVVTWGRILEDGALASDDRFLQDGEPLIATTHAIECLAEACDRAEPNSKLVILDGVTAVTRNLQAYDRIVAGQRVVIVADHDDEEQLGALADRGCDIWSASTAEILIGTNNCRTRGSGEIFEGVRRAASNAEHLRITTIPVNDDRLDGAAAALIRAERELSGEQDESLRRLLGMAFGILLDCAAWYSPPSPDTALHFDSRLLSLEREIQLHDRWLSPGASSALREAVMLLRLVRTDENAGWLRLESLVIALDELHTSGRSMTIVTRSASAADALRAALPAYLAGIPIHPASLLPLDIDVDTLVVAAWLRSEGMLRLISRYPAPDIRLVACAFESRWLRQAVGRRDARRRRWRLDDDRKAAILGTLGWTVARDRSRDSNPEPDGAAPPSPGVDGAESDHQLDRLERLARPRRKGTVLTSAPEQERRPARYVGFVGRTYAYLSSGHSLPVVTDVIRGASSAGGRVPMRTVDHLRAGDYVLFRDQGDHDVIGLFAEVALGRERYRERRTLAELWKSALRSIGNTHLEVIQRLRNAGVLKHPATIRGWLLDPDKIGPGSRADLDIIARVSGDTALLNRIDDVWEAIGEVRGAHIAAGSKLSDFLLQELPRNVHGVSEEETRVDLTLGRVWVVQVEEIGEVEERSYTEVNRLLWAGDQWR